ncbi:MAG: DnaJ C-terminal domain-containing protein [Bacteroidota bacterium]
MDYKDYYKILEVDKKATQDEIKKKYRKLAQKYHPDRNPDNKASEDKFKEVQEAYEVLKDPEKRSKYDQLGANWKQYQQAGAGGGGFDFSQWAQRGGGQQYRTTFDDMFGQEGGFSDFFESFFGGGFSRGGGSGFRTSGFGGGGRQGFAASKGRDYEAQIRLHLSDAYHGTSTILNVDGNRIRVNLKPGLRDGQTLRVRGKGGASPDGGPAGDLLLKINVVNNTSFEVKGNDLHINQDVDLYTAVLGGKIAINAFDKPLSIKLPKETPNGKVMRLKGKGMPVYGKTGEYGDLYVKINVNIPQNLSEKERQLFKELAELRK